MSFSSVLHILYQTVLNFPVISGVLFALPIFAILYVSFALFRNWKRGKNAARIIAIILGIIAFFGLPVLFNSSVNEISYLTDWLFHITTVLIVIIYVYFVVWFFTIPSRKFVYK